MIKRIKVRNFLSLKEVDLELGLRNVLVGPNMSGKSNLIECLRFLQEAVSRPADLQTTGLQQAFFRRGGFREVAWKGEAEAKISFEVIAEFPAPKDVSVRSHTYTYEVSVALGEYGQPLVDAERLTAHRRGKSELILEASGGKRRVYDGTVEGPQNTMGLDLQAYGMPEGTKELKDFISGWRFYHLVPALMRESNPPSPEKDLTENGENLSAWLLTLQTHTDEFQRIKQVCRDVLPGLAEILFQPVQARKATTSALGGTGISDTIRMESATISIGASEKNFKKPISVARMSDGELAFLALMSLILAPDELTPPLLCIEEPENYLHPKLIEVLVEILNQRQAEPRAPQIIATTHSPLLVDKLAIDDLILAERANGATKFTRASSKKRLRELLARKEMGLGDLWYSGALGDS